MTESSNTAAAPAYYSRREAQERALADRAADPVARRVHAELAECYARLIGLGTTTA